MADLYIRYSRKPHGLLDSQHLFRSNAGVKKRHLAKMNVPPQRTFLARLEDPVYKDTRDFMPSPPFLTAGKPAHLTLDSPLPLLVDGALEPYSANEPAAEVRVATDALPPVRMEKDRHVQDLPSLDHGTSIGTPENGTRTKQQSLECSNSSAPGSSTVLSQVDPPLPSNIGHSQLDLPDDLEIEDNRHATALSQSDEIVSPDLCDGMNQQSSANSEYPVAVWQTPPFPAPLMDSPHPTLEAHLPSSSEPSWAAYTGVSSALSSLMGAVAHDDAMAVDDPRRDYDFLNFVDSWRMLKGPTQACHVTPASKPNLQSLEYLRSRPLYVDSRSTARGEVDMQGIDWTLMGVSRQDTTIARIACHPERHHRPLEAGDIKAFILSDAQTTEMRYCFRSCNFQHRARFSHYQLRNALACRDRASIFYANRSKVYAASMACPSSIRTVIDLSKSNMSPNGVPITCIASSPSRSFSDYSTDCIVLAGGFNGEYALMSIDDKQRSQVYEGFVTHNYNSIVTHIHTLSDRRSGLLQAAFCSNDKKLRVMDARAARFVNTFSFDHAINCAAPSPDSRLCALIGDSNDTFIMDADKGEVLVKLREHKDHGFACAWSSCGVYVATGAQDGQTLVWDARNWSTPMQSLHSAIACPRSLAFTDDGALVVANQEDIVSIHSLRSFDLQQDISFFGTITGMAVLDGGSELVIANGDRTLGGLLAFHRMAQGPVTAEYSGRRPAHRSRTLDIVREVLV